MNLLELSPPELLALHAKAAEELRTRGITRSANSPTDHLAEYLFCKAFGWKQVGNSQANVDAIGPDQLRYQIKQPTTWKSSLASVSPETRNSGRTSKPN